MKRFAIVIAGTVLLLLCGVIVAPTFVNWNKYKERIVTQLQDSTGHKYNIGGSLEFAILPYPHLMIEELVISTPLLDGDYAPFLSLNRADISIELWPLFNKTVKVNRIRLVEPIIDLVLDLNGSPLWMTDKLNEIIKSNEAANQSDAMKRQKDLFESITLEEIEIDNGSFNYLDKRKHKKYSFDHIEMTIGGESLLGPFELDGSFSYSGHQINLNTTTGRIGNTQSIALQAELIIPSNSSNIKYSGVIDYGEDSGVLGETLIETNNIGKLLEVFSGKESSQLFDYALSSKGLLDVSKNKVFYKNLSFDISGIKGSGSIEAHKVNGDDLLDVKVEVASDSTVYLDKILSLSSKDKGSDFIPDSIVLPQNINANFDVKLGAVVYKEQVFKYFQLEFDKQGGLAKVKTKMVPPGDGSVDAFVKVGFGSSSISKVTKSITYSEPLVEVDINIISHDMYDLFKLALTDQKLKNVSSLTQNPGSISLKAEVLPKSIKIIDSLISIEKELLTLNGNFSKRDLERDILTLSLGAKNLNLDQWIKALKVPSSKKAVSIEEALSQVSLPYDFTVNIALEDLRLYNTDLALIQFYGAANGKSLNIKNAIIKDLKGNSLNLSGKLGDYNNLHDIDLIVSGASGDLNSLLQVLKVSNSRFPKIDEIGVIVELKGHSDLLSFTTNIKALKGTLEASGSLKDVFTNSNVDNLSFRLKHPDYADLIKAFDHTVSSSLAKGNSLDIFTNMKQNDKVYNFSNIKANLGAMPISGDMKADISGHKPLVQANLQFGDLLISDILGHKSVPSKTTNSNKQAGQDVRWSRDAINTSWMHLANIDLQATAKSIIYGNWNVSDAALNISLNDGILNVKKMDGALHDGHIALSGLVKSIQSPRESLTVSGKLDVRKVSLESFVSSFSGSNLLNAKGGFSLDGVYEASGLSPAALISDLQGNGTSDGVNLVFEGFDLARLSRTLSQPSSSMTENFTSLLNVSIGGGFTKFDTLIAKYSIKDGTIIFDELFLYGPDANITGVGNINLPLWTIDLETSIKLIEPEDSPALKAIFKGRLDKPKQTFGKSALDAYFQSQLGELIEKSILRKFQKKEVIDSPSVTKEIDQSSDVSQNEAEMPKQQEQPVKTQENKDVSPEELFKGILKGLIDN